MNEDIFALAEQNVQTAWEIIDQSRIIQLWEGIGATVHIVGSLKTNLMIHKDIDMHIYTDRISVTDSFSVIGRLAEKLNFTDIQYKNLIDTEEECLEWHARYEDKNNDSWKFDMIHIRKGSKYDGVVEKTTEAIRLKLTPELRRIILRIKYDMPQKALIPGIEVYRAVFTGQVKSYEELLIWRQNNLLTDSLSWLP